VYANEQGWLNFTGDDEIKQPQTNVNEIMDILRQVNEGKITAEEGVAQLTSEVNSLEGQVGSLEGQVEHTGTKNKIKKCNLSGATQWC